MTPLGVGLIGAGRFGRFVVDAVSDLGTVAIRSVTDVQAAPAAELAAAHSAHVTPDVDTLLCDPAVDVVVVATPPATHAGLAEAALDAGKHVFCEKPLALDHASAERVVAAVRRTGRVLVVDHVLRYNPLLRALARMPRTLRGPVQRFLFENDAADEDLAPDHWFWDESRSGGIFVEHGVHFFDAAALLVDGDPVAVSAMCARRADGTVDSVTATVLHAQPGSADVLATHTHSFTHAHRCERQLMRLDFGEAEARVDGWIPVQATLDIWTDDAGAQAAELLPSRAHDLMAVDGFRLGPDARVELDRLPGDGAAGSAQARGLPVELCHHLLLRLTLGGPAAKQRVYAESVRAAMRDLVRCARSGGPPACGATEGAAAVAVAEAATRAAAAGRTIPLSTYAHQADPPSLHGASP